MRSLHLHLIPDPLDVVDTNAAPQWLRIALLMHELPKFKDSEYKWVQFETPLASLPVEQIKTFLVPYENVFRMADQAAHVRECDWGLPVITMQNITSVLLPDIQQMRTIANLLRLRCRLEMREGKLQEALQTITTGLTLARHIQQNKNNTMIGSLVAVAIASVFMEALEEWLQQPGAGNLYWALTELPSPLIDCRPSMRYELNNFARSFPQLRKSAQGPMTVDQVNQLADSMIDSIRQLNGAYQVGSKTTPVSEHWAGRLGLATLGIRIYPEAKQSLIEGGMTPAQVEAMPSLQVVFVYLQQQYDDIRQDIQKWLDVEPWQARTGLSAAITRSNQLLRDNNPLMALLLPALNKVFDAHLRLQHRIATLRTVEAIRLHAATHGGKLPEALEDISQIPLPINPVTGKDFREYYALEKGVAVLKVPSPMAHVPPIARRYEFTSEKN